MGQITAWTITQETAAASTTEVGAINPGSLYDIAEELGYSVEEWYGKANSFTLGTGTTPGVCHLLIRKQDIDLFDLNQFLIVKATAGNEVATFGKLLATRCVAIYANSNEPSANVAYLLTLADRRHVLRMKTIDDLFNVRTPEPTATSGAGLYYAGSLSGGTTVWTWQTMLTRIWDQYVALGLSSPFAPNASPTLPYTPDGTPEGFRFHGVSALEAYGAVLDKINCVLCYNIFTDTFSLQRKSASQADTAGFSALSNASRELATQAPKRCKAASIPEKIRVYFRAIEKFTGSGMDTNNGSGGGEYGSADGPYWTAPSVFVDVSTGIAGAIAGTRVSVWDDLPAIMPNGFRSSQASTADNTTDLTARANAIASEWGTDASDHCDPLRRLFSGYAKTVLTGSEINRIIWSDYGDDDVGPTTEYRRNEPSRYDHELDLMALFSRESVSPPDIGRSLLVRPRETQLVEITGAQSTETDANGVYPGKIIRTDFRTTPGSTAAIPYTDENEIWIVNIATGAATFGSVTFATRTIPTGQRYLGRLIGWKTVDDVTRPVYAIDTDASKASWVEFTLVNAMAGTSTSTGATVNDYGGPYPHVIDPGSTVTVRDKQGLWKYAPVGAKGVAIFDGIEDNYRIVECQLKQQFLRGTLSGALTTSGTLSITSSWGKGVAVSGSVTVLNPGSFFTGSGGEEAMAAYDPESDTWTLVWVECP